MALLNPSYLIDRPNETREYIQAWSVAGLYLQKKFNEYNKSEEVNQGFTWLKTKLTRPSFDSFSFRYKNQVFSVLIDLIELIDLDFISQTTGMAKKLQIDFCNENNMIPCLFKVKKRNFQPVTGGWNLFDTRDGKKINPFELAGSKLVKISDWEMLNWGVNFVVEKIMNEGNKILSFTDAPGISPNIWFEDKKGDKHWVQVSVNGKPEKVELIEDDDISGYKGYTTNVLLFPIEGQDAIYRSQPAKIGYSGLQTFNSN